MKSQFFAFLALIISLAGCLESTQDSRTPPSQYDDVWDLLTYGCNATADTPWPGGATFRLSMNSTSARAVLVSSSVPPARCQTIQTVSYLSSDMIRIVDGTTSCDTSSITEIFPWGDGPEDITFRFVNTGSRLYLSRSQGTGGCAAGQTLNYIFQRY